MNTQHGPWDADGKCLHCGVDANKLAAAIVEWNAAIHHSGSNYGGNYTWAYHGGNTVRYTPAATQLQMLAVRLEARR